MVNSKKRFNLTQCLVVVKSAKKPNHDWLFLDRVDDPVTPEYSLESTDVTLCGGCHASKNNLGIALASASLLDRSRSIRQYIKRVWEPFNSAKDDSLVAPVHRAASAPWLIPN
jgi:hypothetical protein